MTDGAGVAMTPEASLEQTRRSFLTYPHGVMAVGSVVDGQKVGLAVSAFVSVSLSPPLILICIDKESTTWPRLAPAGEVGVSVLSADHADFAMQLASRRRDRFEGQRFTETPAGALLLDGSPARFACTVHSILDGGDHLMVLLEVRHLEMEPEIEPLVWHNNTLRTLAP